MSRSGHAVKLPGKEVHVGTCTGVRVNEVAQHVNDLSKEKDDLIAQLARLKQKVRK